MTNVPQQPVQVEWRLILDDGSNAVKIVPVTGQSLLIGRALTTDIHLDDARISRHHARLTRQGEQLLIEDLQTVNGTLVNGQPLIHPYPLQPNDVISLGPFTIKVEQTLTPQARLETRAYAPPAQAVSRLWLLLAVAGLGLVLMSLLSWGLYRYIVGSGPAGRPAASAGTGSGPTLTITQAPANNSAVSINQPLTIQALASDTAGVTRLELWVNGRKVDEVDTQLVEVGPTLNATLKWRPTTPGPATLELRAYNSSGQVSLQPLANLSVVGQLDTPTPSPSPTPTPTIVPLLPTETPAPLPTDTPTPSPTTTPLPSPTPIPATPTPSLALLTLNVPALNVRTGPGTQYPTIGQLTQGNQAEIVGQANAGQGLWWEIRFAAGAGGVGWVSADPTFGTGSNVAGVPLVSVPTPVSPAPLVPTPSAPPTSTPLPSVATTIPAAPAATVIRAPAGKTLLIVSNRSLTNQPALLTLSGGKSVGGGREVDAPAGNDIQLVLEPDFYRALWSSPARPGGFVRGADFTAVKDKLIVMWIVPEDGRTGTEMYDELTVGGPAPTPTLAPAATTTPIPILGNYIAPAGKAIFVAANRTLNNSFAVLNLSGGSFGGGQEIKLDAGVEIPLELLPGSYRAVWTSPARRGGFSAGREFRVSAGEVILSWIIPDQGQVFMQFPGQEPQQINN